MSSRTEAIQHRIDAAGLQCKIGKNQHTSFNVLLSGSNDDMKLLQSNGKLDEWCSDNLDWLAKTYGKDNIVSAVLHLDETTPHIHTTVVPIVTTERKKKKHEEQAKKHYRKKSPNAARLCVNDVMTREKFKEYQDTYAKAMAKYGLLRGVRGSDARHISTAEYYRELITQTSALEQQQKEAQSELSKVKADVSKERLKNSAANVGSKLINGVSSLLGTPKMAKIELDNKNLHDKIEQLESEKTTIRQRVETVKQNAASQITALKQQFNDRKQELIKENSEQKSTLQKIYDLFPHIKELLRWEGFLKSIGLSDGMVRRLFNKETVVGSGELYSKEHSKRFKVENATLKLEQDKAKPENIRFTINGTDIFDWFKQKQKEFLSALGINPKESRRRKI